MTESDLALGDRVLRVREAGDPDGNPVVYFHATPGSRLDMASSEGLAADMGVRLVSFDRPGYGGSTPARFGLASVAEDAAAVADELGIERFATLGQSGGGPFSLAAAVVLGDRVTRAGVASGPGPFELVPDALDILDDNDTAALALLPGDPIGAARGFAEGFERLVASFRATPADGVMAAFHDALSPHDRELMADPRLATAIGLSMKEALRQGPTGAGWDNVAWVGPWEVDPTSVSQPVLLWYGDEDRFVPPANGVWLHQHVPGSQLVMRTGEGHMGFLEHTAEMFRALTADAS